MVDTAILSACCKAPVDIQGHATKHWFCTICGTSCDFTASSRPLGINDRIGLVHTD